MEGNKSILSFLKTIVPEFILSLSLLSQFPATVNNFSLNKPLGYYIYRAEYKIYPLDRLNGIILCG